MSDDDNIKPEGEGNDSATAEELGGHPEEPQPEEKAEPAHDNSQAIDPEVIKKAMPETWEELEKFHKDFDELEEKIKAATSLTALPGMHGIVRTVLIFLEKFNYIKADGAELAYFKEQIQKDNVKARAQIESNIRDKKFKEMYMDAVQGKAAVEREKAKKSNQTEDAKE